MAGTKKIHGATFNDYTRVPVKKKKKVSRGKAKKK